MSSLISRRQFGRRVFATSLPLVLPNILTAAAESMAVPQSRIKGVEFGVQSFSYHDLPAGDPDACIPMLITLMTEVGLANCEVMSKHLEPFTGFAGLGYWTETTNDAELKKTRQKAREWRLTVSMEYFRNIRRRFEAAGLRIPIYNFAFNDTFTDEEIDRTFEAAKTLGATAFSGSLRLSQAKRLVPFVEKHKMYIAMHNHNNLFDPEEFATPQSFQRALDLSEYFRVNLDLGHFTAANFDPLAFIEDHHDRVLNLHLRDRKRDNGPMTPFGEGDTPISQILKLIQKKQWPIMCNIEFAYGSLCPDVDEVKRCLNYCTQAIA